MGSLAVAQQDEVSESHHLNGYHYPHRSLEHVLQSLEVLLRDSGAVGPRIEEGILGLSAPGPRAGKSRCVGRPVIGLPRAMAGGPY